MISSDAAAGLAFACVYRGAELMTSVEVTSSRGLLVLARFTRDGSGGGGGLRFTRALHPHRELAARQPHLQRLAACDLLRVAHDVAVAQHHRVAALEHGERRQRGELA